MVTNHLRYSHHFQLSILRRQPGTVSGKWLCDVTNNGRNSKEDVLSGEKLVENSIRITTHCGAVILFVV